MALNHCAIEGNLGKAPEYRSTRDGKGFASFSLAHNKAKKQGDGTWKTEVMWFNVTVWSSGGEYDKASNVVSEFKAGDRAVVVGRLWFSDWTDSSGNNRTSFEVVADTVIKVEKVRRDRSGGGDGASTGTEDEF